MLISLVRLRRTLAPLLLAGFALALGGEVRAHEGPADGEHPHGAHADPELDEAGTPRAHTHPGHDEGVVPGEHGAHPDPLPEAHHAHDEGQTGSHHAGHTCDGCVCAATAGCSAPASPATPRTSASPPHHQAPGLTVRSEFAGPPPLHEIFRPPRTLI